MKSFITLAVAGLSLAATTAFADNCRKDPQSEGMRARVQTMQQQMDQAEWTEDRVQQRHLMDLHMKHMQEGMRELRKRDLPAECRMELMTEMMETMIRHHQLEPQQPKP